MNTGAGTDVDALARWRRGVAGVVAKGRRVDPAKLGEQPERHLDTTTYDGLTLAPLYTRTDATPASALPGTWPFIRGTRADRDPTVGWGVRVRHGDGPDSDVARLNRAVLDDLENGATSIWLGVGPGALSPEEMGAALEGVFLDLAPVVLDAGTGFTAAADVFLGLLDAADIEPGDAHANLGADPLMPLVATDGGSGTGGGLDELVALARRAHAHPAPVRAITVDGDTLHGQGASDAQELGLSLAVGVEYLRALTVGGLSAAEALGQFEFRLAATDDQFATIAKLRAGRTLWARVAQVCGAPGAGAAPQHAVTSAAMMTRREPWVNALRTTVATFAAGVGGADSVTVRPFDDALPEGVPGVSDRFAARMARNTQLLLLEESHLGRVLDPGGGSFYVEHRTVALARAAWAVFTDVERAGGFRAAVAAGLVRAGIDRVRGAREHDVAHRVTSITGVSRFPDLDETLPAPGPAPAVPVHRWAEPFEALRDRGDAHLRTTGTRPRVRLVALGPAAEHGVRAGWVRTLLAAGGIATTEDAGAVAVLCGTDARYGTEGAAALARLRVEGATHVLLAGPVSALGPEAGPVEATLQDGIDAVAALAGLHDLLEVAA